MTRLLTLALSLIVAIICAACGSFFFWRILVSREPFSTKKALIVSAVSGCLMSIAFTCIVLIVSALEGPSSFEGLLAGIIVAGVLGMAVALGTYWQLFITQKYKGYLHKKFGKEKDG